MGEAVRFLGSLRLLLSFVVRAAPGRSAVFFALLLVEGLLGPVVIALSGLAVQRAPAALDAGPTSAGAYDLGVVVVLIAVAFAVGQALAPVRSALATSIGSSLTQQMRDRLLDATTSPAGVAHLDDPVVADEIQRAGQYEAGAMAPMTSIMQELGTAATTVVVGGGAAYLLAGFAWWAPVLLVGAAVATHVWMAPDERRVILEREEFAVGERRANYLRDLALDPPAAKETRLFGLVDFLVAETRRQRQGVLERMWRARRARLVPVLATIATIAGAAGLVIGALAWAAVDGQVTAAELTVDVQAIYAIGLLGHPLLSTWWVRQGAEALPHLLRLPERTFTARSCLAGSTSAAGLPRREIRLTGVRFSYSNGRPVLDGLDLTIPAGTSLAIVGANGEGKTTLLKLLARLYDPDAGAILVDGHDLRDIAPDTWRRQLAVIFQDFVRYEASARDNIGFGRVDDLDNLEAARRAAGRSGALDLIEQLPSGWDTILSRQYPDGVDLSGGQWQRVALARALRAAEGGAKLLVLDEPTAALDVAAEAELFDRFLELTAGITTVLVTHRLSSVRHVDRIAVLDNGRVAELGSHEELLAADGTYARMFRLQAQRFATGASRG
jgi:ATP-binding cassette, subfamily B, bacterial